MTSPEAHAMVIELAKELDVRTFERDRWKTLALVAIATEAEKVRAFNMVYGEVMHRRTAEQSQRELRRRQEEELV